MVPLPPSNRQYKICLQRKGFQDQVFFVASHEDDIGHKVAEWDPVVRGVDWGQDFEAAKKTAADGHKKNVFVFFDKSDAKESSFASSRFTEAVALRKEFRQRADKEYVCVYIDNPEKEEAQKQGGQRRPQSGTHQEVPRQGISHGDRHRSQRPAVRLSGRLQDPRNQRLPADHGRVGRPTARTSSRCSPRSTPCPRTAATPSSSDDSSIFWRSKS